MSQRKAATPLELQELSRVLLAIGGAQQRGSALLACAWLADSLGEALKTRLLPDPQSLKILFTNRGALADFQPRIHLAYAIRLIEKDFRDELERIRDIRNEFAHLRDPVDFSDRSIRDRCQNLETARLFEEAASDTFESPYDRFIVSVGLLAGMLVAEAKQPSSPHRPLSLKKAQNAFSVQILAKVFALLRAIGKSIAKPA